MPSLIQIPISNLIADPLQPRKEFNHEKLSELAESIQANGVKTPISVRKNPNAAQDGCEFMIIAGERRWRASQLAEMETIPAVLEDDDKSLTQQEIYAHQLLENLHREDLNPVERAIFIQDRIDFLKGEGVGNAAKQVAEELGHSTSWVSKNTSILKESDDIRNFVAEGKIRDYSLIKKISGLKGKKRAEAFSLIESGDFNAKEFFKRKRKPAKTEEENPLQDVGEASASGTMEDEVTTRLPKMTHELWVKVMAHTEYGAYLDGQNPQWKNMDRSEINKEVRNFLKWVEE